MPEPPASTFEPTLQTSRCWTAGARRSGPSSSRSACGSGSRSRTHSERRPPMKVTADAARRFLVARHLLAPARSLDGGPDAVLEVFRRLGSVQFDPLAIAGRNHDLVLHARVADYDPGRCARLSDR